MKLNLSNQKKTLGRKIFFFLVLVCLTPLTIFATEYYVTPSGDDFNNDGSAASPFQSINRATNLAQPGDIVNIGAGTYREAVNIRRPGITVRPYPGEKVIINGCDLQLTWTLVAGTTYRTTTSATNLNERWGTNQVFSDGKMIELARWPKQTSADIGRPTNAFAESVSITSNSITITDFDFFQPAARWVGAKIWINLSRNGYDGQGWTGVVTAISGNNITVDFSRPHPPRTGNQPWGVGTNTEYFLFDPTPGAVVSAGINNILANGEWWRNGSELFVKCPNGGVPNATGTGTNVIEAKSRYFGFSSTGGVGGYTIQNIDLFGCTLVTDLSATFNGTTLESATNIMLDGLKFTYPSHVTSFNSNYQADHYTWSGVSLNGRNITLKNSTIKYTSASGLSIQGSGHKILNNTLEATNFLCSNAGAMNTGFTCLDAEIANNKIFNTTVMAINIRYSKNSDPNTRGLYRIHHNEIYDFMTRSGDSGAIDVFASDLQWMRIDHNLIYNTALNPQNSNNQVAAIYTDYGGAFKNIRVTIDHNIITNVRQAVLINPGKNVELFNNTIISGGPGSIIAIEVNTDYSEDSGIKIYNNILDGPVVRNNLSSGALPPLDVRNNITNATGSVLNDLFVDAANRNFNLKPTATNAIDKGISVGVYDDNVVGIPDLGAIEWGSNTPADTQAPATITNITASGITSTAFTLNYSTTDNVGVAAYDIFINGVFKMNTPLDNVTFTGLTPTTTYNVVIIAIDATGNRSAASAVFPVKTALPAGVTQTGDVTPPSVPTGLNITDRTPNSGTINWTASTDNEGIAGYEVFLDGNYLLTVSTLSAFLSGYQPNTFRNIQVRAKDNMGNVSALSPVLVFQTYPLNSGTIYEAEAGATGGGTFAQTNNPGFSGTGFIAGFEATGAQLTYTVNATIAGSNDVLVRYALGFPQDQVHAIFVNGVRQKTITFRSTGNWLNWGFVSTKLNLIAGTNTIRFVNEGNGTLNHDYVVVVDNTVLPVTIDKFTGEFVGKSVRLFWNTKSETDNNHFIIERSGDGLTFTQIGGQVKSKGAQGGSYTLTDANPLNGTSYYRLTQFDNNGTNKELGLVDVKTIIGEGKISFYPNPVTQGVMNINFGGNGEGELFTVRITDLVGRTVYTTQLKNNGDSQAVNIGNLPTGIYTINIVGGTINYASKLVVY